MKAQTPTAAAGGLRCGRRVSAAIEQLPNSCAGLSRGRFSTGHEQRPEGPDKFRIGRYSRGLEQMPDSRGKLRAACHLPHADGSLVQRSIVGDHGQADRERVLHAQLRS
jgi:hypothetical protein